MIISVGADVEKLETLSTIMGLQKVQLLWKTTWQLSKQVNVRFAHAPAIPLLALGPREGNTHPHRHVHTGVQAALFKIDKRWKQPK